MASHWLARLVRHRLLDEGDARRLIGDDALAGITRRVAASEAKHTGQIRVCIEAGLPWGYIRRSASPRERALAMFAKLGVWDTEHDNGVLIYLLVAERAIEIVADRGIGRHIDAAGWKAIMATMESAFAAGRFDDGLGQAIDAVDALLTQHFPRAPGTIGYNNELPDAPVIR